MKVFSERLAKLMQEEKISAYRLAKIVGVSNQCVLNWLDEINEPKLPDLNKALKVSQSIIARWESGECEPTVTNILAIAEYFSVTTDYLLGKDEY